MEFKQQVRGFETLKDELENRTVKSAFVVLCLDKAEAGEGKPPRSDALP